MGLDSAHKGYEYQDLLSSLFILEQMLSGENAVFKIDKKENKSDKFDDITIIRPNLTLKRQIKYSDEKILTKADFSSTKYDLAIDLLFRSWKQHTESQSIDYRICLAWEYLEGNEELVFLKEVKLDNIYENADVKFLKIDIDQIWKKDESPSSTWQRLKQQSKNIKRDEFALFLENLIIEVNLPKASFDITNPDKLEQLVISKLKKFGVGKYPNHSKEINDVLLNLTHIVKSARSKGDDLNINTIIYRLGLKSDFGNIQQDFLLDYELNVVSEDKNVDFHNEIRVNQKTILIGEPGSGKSWFLQNYIKYLEKNNIKVVKHYCYTGLEDVYEKERITINVFLANLIYDIIRACPDLTDCKFTKYGVDINELQNLIYQIKDELIIIIDGLDHIGRIYNFHKSLIKEIDTEIINALSKLEFPGNVKVILATQPIEDVIKLTNINYKKSIIQPWNKEDIEILLMKNCIDNCSIDWNIKLTNILLDKSNGNPLYLTYLINELKSINPIMISRDLIEKFPIYNANLANYYDYIMSKIPEGQSVALILAGAPFNLNIEELIEITKMGNLVQKTLDSIQSILRYNLCNGGFSIYHESFRRYIIESLEKEGVQAAHVIYRDLIEWLKTKGYYNNRKSYLNLLILLFESKRYDEIMEFCNKEFVIESIYYGNNIASLKHNYGVLIKTICINKDYESLIICTELGNMIYSFDYSFEENSKLYYWGLGLVNGFDNLKELLFYEGQMVQSLNDGLAICYLCSQNDVIPNWEPYLNFFKTSDEIKFNNDEKDLELFKHIFCAMLDLDHDIVKLLTFLDRKGYEDYRNIIIGECLRRELIDSLIELTEKNSKKNNWKNSIFSFLGKGSIDEKLLFKYLNCLRLSDSHSDETLQALKYYVNNIKWIIEDKKDALEIFIHDISNRNWFYNWMIFVAKINMVLLSYNEKKLSKIEFVEAYKWLIKDLDCFKGSPRTCDLYKYENLIYESIKSPLSSITDKDTWNEILNILEVMSENTTTSLMGSLCGPLPAYKLFEIFLDIANDQNYEITTHIIETKIGKEEDYRLYTYLVDYALKLTIILSKSGNVIDARQKFKEGVKYLLSYSFRKDRTLSHLMDCVLSTYNINNNTGLKNILRLKPLADAVVHHTDGKSTKKYQKEWFELLITADINLAMTYLQNELLIRTNHWIFEECLESLILAFKNGDSAFLQCSLFKTFPGNFSDDFIEAYAQKIDCLIKEDKILQARKALYDLLRRCSNHKIDDINLINHLHELCSLLGCEDTLAFDLKKSIIKKNDTNINKAKYFGRLSFDCMSRDQMLNHIKEKGINETDLQSLYYYLSNLDKLDNDTMIFLSGFIKICFDYRSNDRKTKENLITIIDNINIDSEVMAFMYMHMFLIHADGWYNRFTMSEFFQKAYMYNPQIAEDHFFDYVYNNFSSVDYSLAVGGELINALALVENHKEGVMNYWNNLFDIISFRLPGQMDYNWEPIIQKSNEFDDEEKLISLIFSRFKYGESSRFDNLISDLNHLLKFKNIREKFKRPFHDLIMQQEIFCEYVIIVLLKLIIDNFTSDEINLIIKDEIKSVYPTQKPIIDYLCRIIIGEHKNRIYLDYHKRYNHSDPRTNYFLKRMLMLDNRLSLLSEYGIDVGYIVDTYVNKIMSKEFTKDYNDLLFNRTYSLLIPNIYFHDILTKMMGDEAELYLNSLAGKPFLEELESVIFSIIIGDYKLSIAINNSAALRPNQLELPENVNEGTNDIIIDEWVRIAYYEKFFYDIKEHKDNFGENLKTTVILSGIGFKNGEYRLPFLKLNKDFSFGNQNSNDNPFFMPGLHNAYFIETNIQLLEDPYLTHRNDKYIGIENNVLDLLNIQMSDCDYGIIGVDRQSNEEVLKYLTWSNCYYSDNLNDTIPYLMGGQLLMKKSKYDELCKLTNKVPYQYTTKIEIDKNV